MKKPKRGSRAQLNKQKQQAGQIRKSASNQGGASVGGGSA